MDTYQPMEVLQQTEFRVGKLSTNPSHQIVSADCHLWIRITNRPATHSDWRYTNREMRLAIISQAQAPSNGGFVAVWRFPLRVVWPYRVSI